LDRNDNAPRFLKSKYYGNISESAPLFSHVISNNNSLLVISTEDLDSEINALRNYEIVEPLASDYFSIESTTGAVKIIKELDYENIPSFTFHVNVIDMGKPRLSSETTAEVRIDVVDVNDCTPTFDLPDYNITLLLPTYKNVAVVTVHATDPDSVQTNALRYYIIDGDSDKLFEMDSLTGTLIIVYPERLKNFHRLHIRVSDGKYSSLTRINIKVEKSESSGLVFQKSQYEGSVVENSTKKVTITVVNVIGNTLDEHVEFKILNPTDMFTIGLTSGAIQTTGKKFDRELKDNYLLIIEARSTGGTYDRENDMPRIAHVKVNVTILDINDFCPMFINLPYYAVVSVDDQKGTVITKVHAIDMDSMENGEVRYEMKRGHGELFKVCRKSGEISLKQNLEGHNKEYQLVIGAYDGGSYRFVFFVL
jgi:protocadherin Fat 1/2/3